MNSSIGWCNNRLQSISMDDDRIEQLKAKEHKLGEQISRIKEQTHKVLKKAQIFCGECKRQSNVEDITMLVKMSYCAPYGCTGGDHWITSDELRTVCPLCGCHNRFLDKKSQMAINNMRMCFKRRGEIYDNDIVYECD